MDGQGGPEYGPLRTTPPGGVVTASATDASTWINAKRSSSSIFLFTDPLGNSHESLVESRLTPNLLFIFHNHHRANYVIHRMG